MPPGPFKGLGPGPLRAPLGPLRAWARALLRAPLGPLKGLGPGPLKGPPWALLRAWARALLRAPLGPYGPPWALMGPPGPS